MVLAGLKVYIIEFIDIYTWNPNDLYFWRSTPKTRPFPIKTRVIWVPGRYMIYIDMPFYMTMPEKTIRYCHSIAIYVHFIKHFSTFVHVETWQIGSKVQQKHGNRTNYFGRLLVVLFFGCHESCFFLDFLRHSWLIRLYQINRWNKHQPTSNAGELSRWVNSK